MSNISAPEINEQQNRLTAEKALDLVNGVDINYKGYSLQVQETAVLEGNEAVLNKVLLWLSSKNGDYVREPEKGGPLANLLGKALTEANGRKYEDLITVGFQQQFSDLNLVACTVTPTKDKRWRIHLSVRDPIRDELFEVNVAAQN